MKMEVTSPVTVPIYLKAKVAFLFEEHSPTGDGNYLSRKGSKYW